MIDHLYGWQMQIASIAVTVVSSFLCAKLKTDSGGKLYATRLLEGSWFVYKGGNVFGTLHGQVLPYFLIPTSTLTDLASNVEVQGSLQSWTCDLNACKAFLINCRHTGNTHTQIGWQTLQRSSSTLCHWYTFALVHSSANLNACKGQTMSHTLVHIYHHVIVLWC